MRQFPMFVVPHGCMLNAYMNSRHYWESKNLKIRIGNVSLDGDLMYSVPPLLTTTDDWNTEIERCGGSVPAHYWLEDADGNIYDVLIFDELKQRVVIEGKSPAELKRKSELVYLPFPREIQTYLFLRAYKELRRADEVMTKAFTDGEKGRILIWKGRELAIPFE